MEITINYLAVFAAGIASMVIGGLWYGPLFGKIWVALSGLTSEKLNEQKAKGVGKMYAINFAASLIMMYVLAHFVAVWKPEGIAGAAQLAFWVWLGFVAPVMIGSVLWEGKSWKLYLINIAYQLINLFVAAVILVMWR